jgi:hypothetical protein
MKIAADHVLVEVLGQEMMGGHLVLPATLLGKLQPQRPAVLVEVIRIHPQCRPDPGKAVDHRGNEGTVAKPNDRCRVDRIEERTGVPGGEDGSAALVHHKLRAPDAGLRGMIPPVVKERGKNNFGVSLPGRGLIRLRQNSNRHIVTG